MARLLTSSLLAAVAAACAFASPASAQAPRPITADRIPAALTYQPQEVKLGRGRLVYQNGGQYRLATRVMTNHIIPVVKASLIKPETAEYSDLRTGRLKKTAFYCGTVSAQDADGQMESRRFIARLGLAAVETAENHGAFEAGWRRVGCGF